MVLTDAILRGSEAVRAGIRVFTLNTGRLHAETLAVLDKVNAHYGYTIEQFTPDQEAVENYVQQRPERVLRQRGPAQELLRHPQGGAAEPRAVARRCVDHGPAPRAVRDARRAAVRGTDERAASQVQSAGRLDRGRSVGVPDATTCRSTRCTTRATRASAASRARAR
jgi:hypothetical protein